MKTLVTNRKAFHDYFVIQKWEAGIVLKGSEIKSLRDSGSSIAESWIKIVGNEAWLIGATIPEYKEAKAEWQKHEPTRDRKLLLHRSELSKISRELTTGHTLVPLDVHLNEHNYAKVTVALVKGKKTYDKREAIKERDLKRYGD